MTHSNKQSIRRVTDPANSIKLATCRGVLCSVRVVIAVCAYVCACVCVWSLHSARRVTCSASCALLSSPLGVCLVVRILRRVYCGLWYVACFLWYLCCSLLPVLGVQLFPCYPCCLNLCAQQPLQHLHLVSCMRSWTLQYVFVWRVPLSGALLYKSEAAFYQPSNTLTVPHCQPLF